MEPRKEGRRGALGKDGGLGGVGGREGRDGEEGKRSRHGGVDREGGRAFLLRSNIARARDGAAMFDVVLWRDKFVRALVLAWETFMSGDEAQTGSEAGTVLGVAGVVVSGG